jgi:hypothetical protein
VSGDFVGSNRVRWTNAANFTRILDDVERSDDAVRPSGPIGDLVGNPLGTFSPPIQPGARGEFAAVERWDQALDWIGEPQEVVTAPKATDAPSDNPDSIAAELGLAVALTRDDLNRARRQFMWRNHPDRRPDVPRDVANRRVAIANMLVDRAKVALAERQRAP